MHLLALRRAMDSFKSCSGLLIGLSHSPCPIVHICSLWFSKSRSHNPPSSGGSAEIWPGPPRDFLPLVFHVFFFCLTCIWTCIWTVHKNTHTAAHMLLNVRRCSITFEYQAPQLHTVISSSLRRNMKISGVFFGGGVLSDCITTSTSIADCSSLKYSLTCEWEEGTEQKGSRHTVVADSSWCDVSPLFLSSPECLFSLSMF